MTESRISYHLGTNAAEAVFRCAIGVSAASSAPYGQSCDEFGILMDRLETNSVQTSHCLQSPTRGGELRATQLRDLDCFSPAIGLLHVLNREVVRCMDDEYWAR
jgi:hypothetical protein